MVEAALRLVQVTHVPLSDKGRVIARLSQAFRKERERWIDWMVVLQVPAKVATKRLDEPRRIKEPANLGQGRQDRLAKERMSTPLGPAGTGLLYDDRSLRHSSVGDSPIR